MTSTLRVGAPAPDGWTPDTGATWTYASATTFTVSGDQTTKFRKNTFLKFTQTTVKYAVVASSSHSSGTTTVTIVTNNDYTIANAAISANFYSYHACPQGFPAYFTYTPTFGAQGGSPTVGNGSISGHYSVVGSQVQFTINMTVGSTTNMGTGLASFSLPAGLPYVGIHGVVYLSDSGSQEYIGIIRAGLTNANVVLQPQKNSTGPTYLQPTDPFTPAAGDTFLAAGAYYG